MRIIVLAAGKGKRLVESKLDKPKCLFVINNQPVIVRLIEQIKLLPNNGITIVTGYKNEQIKNCLSIYPEIEYVYNERYDEDVNIFSLYIALKKSVEPVLIIEADTIFDDDFFLNVVPTSDKLSCWFSNGLFKPWQNGGIIKADKGGNVKKIAIVDKYDHKFRLYWKMIGLLKIGIFEIDKYYSFLDNYIKKDIKQYYHIPWVDNISDLPSKMLNVQSIAKVASFNTKDELIKAKELFSDETSIN